MARLSRDLFPVPLKTGLDAGFSFAPAKSHQLNIAHPGINQAANNASSQNAAAKTFDAQAGVDITEQAETFVEHSTGNQDQKIDKDMAKVSEIGAAGHPGSSLGANPRFQDAQDTLKQQRATLKRGSGRNKNIPSPGGLVKNSRTNAQNGDHEPIPSPDRKEPSPEDRQRRAEKAAKARVDPAAYGRLMAELQAPSQHVCDEISPGTASQDVKDRQSGQVADESKISEEITQPQVDEADDFGWNSLSASDVRSLQQHADIVEASASYLPNIVNHNETIPPVQIPERHEDAIMIESGDNHAQPRFPSSPPPYLQDRSADMEQLSNLEAVNLVEEELNDFHSNVDPIDSPSAQLLAETMQVSHDEEMSYARPENINNRERHQENALSAVKQSSAASDMKDSRPLLSAVAKQQSKPEREDTRFNGTREHSRGRSTKVKHLTHHLTKLSKVVKRDPRTPVPRQGRRSQEPHDGLLCPEKKGQAQGLFVDISGMPTNCKDLQSQLDRFEKHQVWRFAKETELVAEDLDRDFQTCSLHNQKLEKEVKQLKENISEQTRSYEASKKELRARLKKMQDYLTGLANNHNSFRDEIIAGKKRLESLKNTTFVEPQVVESLKREISELEGRIKDKDSEIGKLEARVASNNVLEEVFKKELGNLRQAMEQSTQLFSGYKAELSESISGIRASNTQSEATRREDHATVVRELKNIQSTFASASEALDKIPTDVPNHSGDFAKLETQFNSLMSKMQTLAETGAKSSKLDRIIGGAKNIHTALRALQNGFTTEGNHLEIQSQHRIDIACLKERVSSILTALEKSEYQYRELLKKYNAREGENHELRADLEELQTHYDTDSGLQFDLEAAQSQLDTQTREHNAEKQMLDDVVEKLKQQLESAQHINRVNDEQAADLEQRVQHETLKIRRELIELCRAYKAHTNNACKEEIQRAVSRRVEQADITAKLKRQLDECTQSLEKCRTQLAGFKEKQTGLQKELEEKANALEQYELDAPQAQDNILQLKKQLEDKSATIEGYKRNLNEAQKTGAQLRQQLADDSTRVEVLSEKLGRARDTTDQIKKQLENKSTEVEELSTRLAASQGAEVEAQAQLGQSLSACEEHEKAKDQAEEAAIRLQTQLDESYRALKGCEEQLEKTNSAITALRKETETDAVSFKSLQNHYDKMKDTVVTLQDQLEESREETNQAQKKFDELQTYVSGEAERESNKEEQVRNQTKMDLMTLLLGLLPQDVDVPQTLEDTIHSLSQLLASARTAPTSTAQDPVVLRFKGPSEHQHVTQRGEPPETFGPTPVSQANDQDESMNQTVQDNTEETQALAKMSLASHTGGMQGEEERAFDASQPLSEDLLALDEAIPVAPERQPTVARPGKWATRAGRMNPPEINSAPLPKIPSTPRMSSRQPGQASFEEIQNSGSPIGDITGIFPSANSRPVSNQGARRSSYFRGTEPSQDRDDRVRQTMNELRQIPIQHNTPSSQLRYGSMQHHSKQRVGPTKRSQTASHARNQGKDDSGAGRLRSSVHRERGVDHDAEGESQQVETQQGAPGLARKRTSSISSLTSVSSIVDDDFPVRKDKRDGRKDVPGKLVESQPNDAELESQEMRRPFKSTRQPTAKRRRETPLPTPNKAFKLTSLARLRPSIAERDGLGPTIATPKHKAGGTAPQKAVRRRSTVTKYTERFESAITLRKGA